MASPSVSPGSNGGGSDDHTGGPLKKRIKVEAALAAAAAVASDSRLSPPQTTNILKMVELPKTPIPPAPSADAIRCEPCDIGFSQLSNYVAHKKYYCRGGGGGEKDEAKTSLNGTAELKKERD